MIATLKGIEEIARQLLAHGSDPDRMKVSINNSGWTPLILASCMGHTQLVRLLLNSGATMNTITPNNCTALRVAARMERLNVVSAHKMDHSPSFTQVKRTLLRSADCCSMLGQIHMP